MARATIILEDREDGEGVDFTMKIEPEPNPNVPPTAVEAAAFDIAHRLRVMARECEMDDSDGEEWEPT